MLAYVRKSIIIQAVKECDSLHSPTPCLCIDFIFVFTEWKVTARMVHQSHSIAGVNRSITGSSTKATMTCRLKQYHDKQYRYTSRPRQLRTMY